MKEQEFTLIFGVHEDLDAGLIENRLFEAGCGDAAVGLGREGRLALMFSREADSPNHAVACAINEVRRALPKARLLDKSFVTG